MGDYGWILVLVVLNFVVSYVIYKVWRPGGKK